MKRPFAFIPPMKIEGECKKETTSELFREVVVNERGIILYVRQEVKEKYKESLGKDLKDSYTLVELNCDKQIHYLLTPLPEQPLELLNCVSIDFLADLAELISTEIVIFDKEPNAGYLDIFYMNNLPFFVRRPDRSVYNCVSTIKHPSRNYIASLSQSSSQSHEDFIENAIQTFSTNILEPTRETTRNMLEEIGDGNKSTVNILTTDLFRILDRGEDLVQIVENQIKNIRHRNRALMRLVLPTVHRVRIESNLHNYVEITKELGKISLRFKDLSSVSSEAIANFVADRLKDI